MMLLSTLIVFAGIGLGWWLYGRKPIAERRRAGCAGTAAAPASSRCCANKYYMDELYEATVIRFNAWWARACDWLDRLGLERRGAAGFAIWSSGFRWVNRFFDEFVINLGFDQGCGGVTRGGRLLSRLQNGRVQNYLRVIGVALAVLVLFLIWGCRGNERISDSSPS